MDFKKLMKSCKNFVVGDQQQKLHTVLSVFRYWSVGGSALEKMEKQDNFQVQLPETSSCSDTEFQRKCCCNAT